MKLIKTNYGSLKEFLAEEGDTYPDARELRLFLQDFKQKVNTFRSNTESLKEAVNEIGSPTMDFGSSNDKIKRLADTTAELYYRFDKGLDALQKELSRVKK